MSEQAAFKAVKTWLSAQGIDELEAYSQEVAVLMVRYLRARGRRAELVCYRLPGRGNHYSVAVEDILVDPTVGDWNKPPHGTHKGQLYYVGPDSPHHNWREVEIDQEAVLAEVEADFPIEEESRI